MLQTLPCKTPLPGYFLLALLFLSSCGVNADQAGAPNQNIIIWLDLSDRITKTRDQMERDIYLVNTIYQTFGRQVLGALDDGEEMIEQGRFQLLLSCPDDPRRYADLLAQLQVDPSKTTTAALRERFSEDGTIEFSTALYRLYDTAARANPRASRDAVRSFFNETLPPLLIDEPGAINQLFLISDGHQAAPAYEEAAAFYSQSLPELNVLLLEADPGAAPGAWQQMRIEWTERLQRLGVRFVDLEDRQSSILAVREIIASLLTGRRTPILENIPSDSPIAEAPAGYDEHKAPDREKTGVVTGLAKFWLGLPGEDGAMPLLNIEPDVRVQLIEPAGDYFKVRHRQLIGFIERQLVVESKPAEAVADEPPSAKKRRRSNAGLQPVVAKPVAITPCTGALGDELLPGVSCAQYKAKILKKVVDLETYIKAIVDKYARNRTKSIDLACRLFVDEKAKVFTSSMEGARTGRPIRRYLEGLMNLSYDQVEVEWTNIQYVSGLREGPDGRFYGTVHIEQRFEGYIDGRLVYGDVTEKNITVVLEAYEIVDAQGNANTRWDVFLSDIGVEQTKIQG